MEITSIKKNPYNFRIKSEMCKWSIVFEKLNNFCIKKTALCGLFEHPCTAMKHDYTPDRSQLLINLIN